MIFIAGEIAGISDTPECVCVSACITLTFVIEEENTTFQFPFSKNKAEIYLFTFIEPLKGIH